MTSKNEISDLLKRVQSPSASCRPVYSWKWDGPLTKTRIFEEIDAFYGCGIRGFYIIPEPEAFRPETMRTFLSPDYLSDAYLELVRAAAEYAESKGMCMWIYDEGGWPSGSACGQVLEGHPALRQREIAYRIMDLPAGETFEGTGDTLALFRGTERLPMPFTAQADEELTEYFLSTTAAPDRLNPAAVDRFIALTHARHAERLGGLVGRYLTLFFTDEPKPAGKIPFFEGLEFEDKSLLPALADPDSMGDAGKLARIRLYDTLSRRFAETFNGRLKGWCADHGMLLCGHMDHDDDPAAASAGHGAHLLRSLREMDVPGVDAIWRQIFPSEEADNLFFPRFAASAAAQTGGNFVLSESFAVYGAGLTPEQMRYVVGFQAVRGINLFNYMLISYYSDGTPVHHERPDFQPESPACAGLDISDGETARICAFLSEGKPDRTTALYYPVRDFWAGGEDAEKAVRLFWEAGKRLEESQCDFEIVDDDVAERFNIFREIMVPVCRFMPEKTRAALEASGAAVTSYAGGALIGKNPVVKADCPVIRAAKRVSDGERLYFLFNEGFELVTANITVDDGGSGCRIDFESGKITPYRGEALTLESGESVGLIFSDSTEPLKPEETAATVKRISIDRFLLRPIEKTLVQRDGFHKVKPEAAPKRAGTDGWLEILGEDFSGTAEYTATFTAPDLVATAEIDCGDVFCVCEAFLNGQSLGVRAAKPYRFKTDAVRAGENTLCLRVTNTLANQYVKGDWSAGLEKRDIGPYSDRTLAFEKESVRGGLYGGVEVRILTTIREK